MKIRSFLAFDIPEEVKAEMASVISVLASKERDVRWVAPELMHCTIRFFGEVEEKLLFQKLSPMIEQEVLHQAPVRLEARGIGVFPNWRYPRVIWAGIGGETETVVALHSKLEEAFQDFPLPKDQRMLRLHLTMGRAKSPIRANSPLLHLVEKMVEHAFGEFTVDALTLYESRLTKDGPIYTALRRFPLGANARRGANDQ